MRNKTQLSLLLIIALTLSCSPSNINRLLYLDGESIHQNQKGKKGVLEILTFYPNQNLKRYFYTRKNPPTLDSLSVNGQMYRPDNNIGKIVLENEQHNLESYIETLNKI